MMGIQTTEDPRTILRQTYPDGSSDISSKEFVPAWLLVEAYSQLNFDQLKAGNLALRVRKQSVFSDSPLCKH